MLMSLIHRCCSSSLDLSLEDFLSNKEYMKLRIVIQETFIFQDILFCRNQCIFSGNS